MVLLKILKQVFKKLYYIEQQEEQQKLVKKPLKMEEKIKVEVLTIMVHISL